MNLNRLCVVTAEGKKCLPKLFKVSDNLQRIVIRCIFLAASEPHLGAQYAIGAAELRLRKPESAKRESGCLVRNGVGIIR